MTPRRIDLLTLEKEKRSDRGCTQTRRRDERVAARTAAILVAIARAPLEAR